MHHWFKMTCEIMCTYGERLLFKMHHSDKYGLTCKISNHFFQWSGLASGWGCLIRGNIAALEKVVLVNERRPLWQPHMHKQTAEVSLLQGGSGSTGWERSGIKRILPVSNATTWRTALCNYQLKKLAYVVWDNELIHVFISNRANRFWRQSFWFVLRKCRIRILAWTNTIFSEVFRGIPQLLQESVPIIPWNRPRLLPYLSSPVHNSLIILPFDAT